MEVSTRDLREILDKVLDHVEEGGITHLNVERDFYWSIPAESRYDSYATPEDLTVGQLSEDWQNLQAILDGRRDALRYALVWLGRILEAVGETGDG